MHADHERYEAISRLRKAFWRRYLTVVLAPVLTLMLAGGNALFLAVFGAALVGTVIYTRYLLYRLALAAGFAPQSAVRWITASFVLTGVAVAYFVFEAPLRRAQRHMAARAMTQCRECGAEVWEGQTDCMRCGVPVPGTGRPYYDA
jgi:hypothetical protein